LTQSSQEGKKYPVVIKKKGLINTPRPQLQQFEIKPATKMENFKDVKKGDYLEMAAYSIDLQQKILGCISVL